MIPIKTEDEIGIMREGGRIVAGILDELELFSKEGVTTYEIDQEGKRLMDNMGVKSACHNYRMANLYYPGYICISVNEEVVHGIGSLKRELKEGDIVSLDVSIVYKDFVLDTARTIGIGGITDGMARLLSITEGALYRGIAQARAENKVGDISEAIQSYVEKAGFNVVRDFVGHGVGRSMHEEPQIPNFGKRNTGPRLRSGMTLAIEPMVNMGLSGVEYGRDGWTVLTRDRKPSAHFEHTVLVKEGGVEILTISKKDLLKIQNLLN